MGDAITEFIQKLASVPSNATLANHYAEEHPLHDLKGGAAIRRENLTRYLRRFADSPPGWMIVGEAAGYQGNRFSGIPFTSEYTLAHHPFFSTGDFRRSSARERIWREPSASIVWEMMTSIQNHGLQIPMLWGMLPFHPHKPGVALSNRTPTRAEATAGLEFFLALRRIFPRARLLAAGKIASAGLSAAGFKHIPVRHPSHGGKKEFQAGVKLRVRSKD